MASNQVDVVIIGQGLAGSILAFQLMAAAKTVMVIDDQHHHSASKVAAGIINPITGPRLSLSDNFASFYTIAKQFYQKLEDKLNVRLWSEVPQERQIRDRQQFEFYQKRKTNSVYQDYLGEPTHSKYFDPSSTVINVDHSAIVDCKALLNGVRNWLDDRQSYFSTKINYTNIATSSSGFVIEGIQAKNLIFCEGYQAIHNPWLKDLPFVLSKGEILTISTDGKDQQLLNWGNWLAPIGKNFKLGSNYEWDNLDLNTNSNVKKDLLDSLNENTTLEATVINHEAGIRPTTKQRQPFVGPLSNLQNAYCFNGFGSKGCLLIPYYAERLSASLYQGLQLPETLTQWL